MNKIKQYIDKHLKDCIIDDDGTMSATIKYCNDFPAFEGHFPGQPIVPGVCQIQTAITICEEAHNKQYDLKVVKNAKYFQPIMLDDTVQCSCTLNDKNGENILKAKISKDDQKIAQLSLVIK